MDEYYNLCFTKKLNGQVGAKAIIFQTFSLRCPLSCILYIKKLIYQTDGLIFLHQLKHEGYQEQPIFHRIFL